MGSVNAVMSRGWWRCTRTAARCATYFTWLSFGYLTVRHTLRTKQNHKQTQIKGKHIRHTQLHTVPHIRYLELRTRFDWVFLIIYWRTDALMTSTLPNFASHKTNRFHVAVGLYSNRSQNTQNAVRTSVTHSAAPPVPLFVLNRFWRHLWSITEQTHGNMDLLAVHQRRSSFSIRREH